MLIADEKICHPSAGVSELADEADSKSAGREVVRVRVPSPAYMKKPGNARNGPCFSGFFP